MYICNNYYILSEVKLRKNIKKDTPPHASKHKSKLS